MSKRKFIIDFSIFGEVVDQAIIEIDQAVIDAVDDDWRASFYDLHTPEQIAEHVGYNLFINNITISLMDGWADQPRENARILAWPDLDQWDMSAREIKWMTKPHA